MKFRTGNGEISVNVATLAALETLVRENFAEGRGFTLATLNLDHLVKLAADPGFHAAYQAQDLVVADGNPIVWLSRLARQPVDLLPGSDLVIPLARLAARGGQSVALVGSTDESLHRAAAALKTAVPGLSVACTIAPPFGFDPVGPGADAILREVEASGALLCLIALGAPKQELFAARGRTVAPGVGFASIGAGLDFLSGSQTRAPLWVRRLALEWLWRLLGQPGRMFKRYLHCFRILPGHAFRALRQRSSSGR
ncbi:MAG: WecB/TagA/CpsF family glycosyltransferase [Paracoccaceae bacterium]|nr:WecB/TagA/CpsF family glycosyltransferase [Paracoccaceae bacterium]